VFSDARISRGSSGHAGRTIDVSGDHFHAMAVRTAAPMFHFLFQICVVRRLLHGSVCIVMSARGQGPQVYFYVEHRISETGPHNRFGWMMVLVISYSIIVSSFYPYMFLSSFCLSIHTPTTSLPYITS